MSQLGADVVDHERLSLQYNGWALESHSMDVRQLAPSLLALADLFSIAHAELGPTLTPPPALEVTAQRGGSFIVDMWLAAQESGDDLINILNGPRVSAAGAALGLGGPVVIAIRWLVNRFRKGREQVSQVEPGMVRVLWPDGTLLEAPVAAQRLVERMDFSRTAAQVFEPLRKDGVEGIELRTPGRGKARVQVTREDLRAFNSLPEDDEVLSDNTRLVTVSIVNLPLRSHHKWKVDDSTATFWANLEDQGFLARMEAGIERFGVGDRLHVQMRDRQLRTAENGITVDHTIQKVIKHWSLPPPEELPFDHD